MKKLTLPILGLLLAAGAVFYVGDYCVWRIRVASGGRGYDTLTVQYYYAIGEKNGKTEYDFQPPQPETCVNAIFPHGGYSPCWYERRHTEKMIQI